MSKNIKILLAVILVASVFLGVVACSKTADGDKSAGKTKEPDTQGEETKKVDTPQDDITLSVWANNALYLEDELKISQEDWTITKIFKEFEDQNPGVKIELTVEPDEFTAHQTFKTAGLAKSGPDIVCVWTGGHLFALEDVVLPLDDIMPPEDLENIAGWDSVKLDFKDDGKILGYPAGGNEVAGLFYDKSRLAQAGVDLGANPWKTVDDMFADLEKIKNAGILPIMAGEPEINGIMAFNTGKWWAQMAGLERVSSNSQGVTKFVDDKDFLKAIELSSELYKRGYLNEDYATVQDHKARFYQGEGAFFCTGNWDAAEMLENIGEENLGFTIMPDVSPDALAKNAPIGGAGKAIAIANYTKHPEMAVKLVSFINNKENSILLNKVATRIPLRKDISKDDMEWDHEVYNSIFEHSQNVIYWVDNALVPEVADEYYKQGTLGVIGRITPMEVAEKLDLVAAEAN